MKTKKRYYPRGPQINIRLTELQLLRLKNMVAIRNESISKFVRGLLLPVLEGKNT